MCQFHLYVKYGSFLLTLKRSDQVPEAISHLPAVDDTSDSILDSAWVFFYISVNVSWLGFIISASTIFFQLFLEENLSIVLHN